MQHLVHEVLGTAEVGAERLQLLLQVDVGVVVVRGAVGAAPRVPTVRAAAAVAPLDRAREGRGTHVTVGLSSDDASLVGMKAWIMGVYYFRLQALCVVVLSMCM